MAYAYALTGNGTPSTVLRDDGKEFPQVPGNADYEAWLVFTAGGGTTTPAPTISIEDRRTAGKLQLARLAASYERAHTPANQLSSALAFGEAQAWADAVAPDENDFPLLLGEVGRLGADVDEVSLYYLAQVATLKSALGAIAEHHTVLQGLVDACVSQAEIDEVLEGAQFANPPAELDLQPLYLELSLPDPVLRRVEPDFFAAGAGTLADAASIDLPLPAGDLEDKVLVAVILSWDDLTNDPTIVTDDAAWQGIKTDTHNQKILNVFVANGSEVLDPGTFYNQGSIGMYGQIFAFKNTSKAAIAAAIGAVTKVSASVTVTAPEVTPVANHSGVFFIGAAARAESGPTGSRNTGTNPTFAEVADSGAFVTLPNQRFSIAAAFARQSPAGATGIRTATLSGSAQANFGLMLVIPPV